MEPRSAASVTIPLSRPWVPAEAAAYVADVISTGQLGASGRYAVWCESFLQEMSGCARALMTNSGSSALDAACVLIGLVPGDEVIVPSFAFPSAASAVLKCGATPVFVDIEPSYLTVDCSAVEAAISSRSKAIITVDYGGMPCDYDRLSAIAARHDLTIIEDAAHAFDAWFRGKALGTYGALGICSFQQTKNISCGEGGALLVNRNSLVTRAEQFCDKGTNRLEMERGMVPFYQWTRIGAGIGMNEVSAAVLRSQFEQAAAIRRTRRRIFDRYIERLVWLDESEAITLIRPAEEFDHNAHLLAFLAKDRATRDTIISHLNSRGIGAAFHYVPLHGSQAGRRYSRCLHGCPVTEDIVGRIVRLPIYFSLSDDEIDMICAEVTDAVAGPR